MKTWTGIGQRAPRAHQARAPERRTRLKPVTPRVTGPIGCRIAAPVPGSLVNNWGAGNWSGSEDEKLRTMRAGLALQTSHGKRFLIYAVFSDATPSAMARVSSRTGRTTPCCST